MGRPLNHKYFGWRNVGLDGNDLAVDAKIGGAELSGITVGTAGVYTNAQAQALTMTFPAPLIANGVTAVGTPTFTYVNNASVTGTATKAYGKGTGVLSVTAGGGTITFTPTLTSATSGVAVTAVTNTAGVITVASGNYIVGQDFVITTTVGGTTLPSGTYYVAVGGTSVTSITVASSYANAIAGTPVPTTFSTTGSVTATGVLGGNYNSIASLSLVSGGTFLQSAISTVTGALAITDSAGQGVGQTITVTSANFGVNGTTLSVAGDGYAVSDAAQTTAVTFTGSGSAAAATIVALADNTSATPGSLTNRDNAIIAYAYINGSLQEVDIRKQMSTYRYKLNYAYTLSSVAYNSATTISFTSTTTALPVGTKVTISGTNITGTMTLNGTALTADKFYWIGAPVTATTATLYQTLGDAYSSVRPITVSNGTTTGATFNLDQFNNGYKIARLRSDAVADGTLNWTAEEGVEMNIVAIDSAGGTYLVKKLTARKAVLVPKAISRLSSSAGTQFPLVGGYPQVVPWTFGTPTVNVSVQIENA